MSGVAADGLALEYASDALKRNEEVVLAAVDQSAKAFSYAAPALRQDKEFVLRAFAANPDSIMYAAETILADKAFLLRALGLQGNDAMAKVASTLSGDTQVDVTGGRPLPGLYQCDVKFSFGAFEQEILVNPCGCFRFSYGRQMNLLKQQLSPPLLATDLPKGDDWTTCPIVVLGGFGREGDENDPIMFKMEKIEGPVIHWKASHEPDSTPDSTMTWTYFGPRVDKTAGCTSST